MKKIISKFFNSLWIGCGILTELTPHWVGKRFWELVSFLGITSDINRYWIEKRLGIHWIRNMTSTATAVYGFYIFLLVTPFVGTLLIVSYIYDEMMGYIKIHFEGCNATPDPFFMRMKPGIENNILFWVIFLVANTFFMMLLFS